MARPTANEQLGAALRNVIEDVMKSTGGSVTPTATKRPRKAKAENGEEKVTKAKAKTADNGKAKKIVECKVPGCANASKGPRFKFLCGDHRDLPQPKLDKLLAANK